MLTHAACYHAAFTASSIAAFELHNQGTLSWEDKCTVWARYHCG